MRIRPRLGLIVMKNAKETAVKATQTKSDRPSTSVRLAPDVHEELAVRAALKRMSHGDFVRWLLEQVPLDDQDFKRFLTKRKEGKKP